jgi:hypothetical protein
MSEILEKYNIKFTYTDDKRGVVEITSDIDILARIIGSFDTNRKAGWIYHSIKTFLDFGKTDQIKLPEIGEKKILVNKQQATLFEDEAESLTEKAFTLPVAELQDIFLAWLQFLAKCKTRTIEITQGAGIIDIINDGFINAMVIEKPVAAHWPDCGGSVGEYYSVSKHSYQQQRELTAVMNDALISGSDSEVFEAITTFLNLFTNNKYAVAISEIDIEFSEVGSDHLITYGESVSDDDKFTYWHYPNGLDLYLFTRSNDTIDQARVAEYVDMISAGARPKVVVYSVFYNYESNETPYYIVDGHHKLLAYQQLRINAPVVFISRTEDVRPPAKNILPQLLDVLKPNEIIHVLQEDGNTADVTVYMQPAMGHYLDRLLKEKKSVDTNIIRMLFDAYHSNDEKITEWAKQRFAVLSTNNHQGKGQRLPYKSNDPNGYYWYTIFIENLADFYVWKKVVLENGDMPAEIIEKQQMLTERYYPRPKPPEPPPPFPRRAPYESPTRTYPDSPVFRTVGRILLAGMILLSVMRGCG